ncbi:hypothetical protein ACFQ8E_03850 [Isoptericola sp. NPDC056573]|uniref:hypothetical protein n=1 Tax=Isoptericola sp. NPDC056573 TaxID=3345868 RepID=UPI0036AD8B9D
MRRGLGALTVLLVLVTAACGDGGEPSVDDGGGTATGATTSEATVPGDGGDSGSDEGDDDTVGADAGEDLEEPLPQAGGKAQADLPGLLMGGQDFVLVGDAWCGLASIQTDGLPAGVTVEIVQVTVRTAGAALAGAECGEPCAGVTLEPGNLSCGVAVLPPDPGTELVDVSFDATATCSTQEECDQLRQDLEVGSVWSMCHPPGDVGYDCDPATVESSGAATDEPGETGTGEPSEAPENEVTETPEDEVTPGPADEPNDEPTDEPTDQATEKPTEEQGLP